MERVHLESLLFLGFAGAGLRRGEKRLGPERYRLVTGSLHPNGEANQRRGFDGMSSFGYDRALIRCAPDQQHQGEES